jgi:hypothetical protein
MSFFLKFSTGKNLDIIDMWRPIFFAGEGLFAGGMILLFSIIQISEVPI